jgi:hypothetical protein
MLQLLQCSHRYEKRAVKQTFMSNRQHSNSVLLKRWSANHVFNITLHTHHTGITTTDNISFWEEPQKGN